MRLLLTLLLIFINCPQISASGLMGIRLRSAHNQRATVVLSNSADMTHIAFPIILQENIETTFSDLLIDFTETYKVTILIDETPSLGLNSSKYTGTITPARGTISPSTLNLPLNGLRFDFKCDSNLYGEKCNVYCEQLTETGECSTEETEKVWTQETQFSVDYTVNPLKMEMLVAMLRKENEIENSFTSHGPVHRKVAEKIDVTGGLPPVSTPEVLESGLLLEKEKSADATIREFIEGSGSGEFPEELTIRFVQ